MDTIDVDADVRLAGARTPRHSTYECNQGCPVEAALEQIGAKWKGVVLHHLFEEQPLRFSELHRRVGAVTPRVLTRQLRELEADSILHREVYPMVPPRVEYSLTDKGESLRDIIAALRDWGETHVVQVDSRETPAVNAAW